MGIYFFHHLVATMTPEPTKPTKVNFITKFPDLYDTSSQDVSEVSVPKFNYLVCTGKGDPAEKDIFWEAAKTLNGIAFSLKFGLKRNPPPDFYDYMMPPTEAIWLSKGKSKKNRKRQVLLMQPNFISKEMVKRAYEIAKAKNPESGIPRITMKSRKKEHAIQVTHIGPYSKLAGPIRRLRTYAKKHDLEIVGERHEIYLNDPRRTPDEKLTTIIRYRVK